MKKKTCQHFRQTQAYTLVKECCNLKQDDLKCYFNNTLHPIDEKIYDLFCCHCITMTTIFTEDIFSKRQENQINSIIFLTDTRTICMQHVSYMYL